MSTTGRPCARRPSRLAGQGVDRDLPEPGGRVGVEGVGRDAVAGVDGRAGFVAVLEVPAADPVEQR